MDSLTGPVAGVSVATLQARHQGGSKAESPSPLLGALPRQQLGVNRWSCWQHLNPVCETDVQGQSDVSASGLSSRGRTVATGTGGHLFVLSSLPFAQVALGTVVRDHHVAAVLLPVTVRCHSPVPQPVPCCLLNSFWQSHSKCVFSSGPILARI